MTSKDFDDQALAPEARGQDLDSFKASIAQGRVHGALAHRLAVDILKGVYAVGDILPNEIEFSESLNISRTAYREAIRVLSAKGLVDSRPKRGTKVCERSHWNMLDPEVLGWMFEAEPSMAFISGLFELRLITEPAAAELAALRVTEAQLVQMEAALVQMERHGLRTEEGRNGDLLFHKTLLQATHNEALASLSSSIESAVRWSTLFKVKDVQSFRDSTPDHRRVYEAIAARDSARARWCMETLIRLALEDTKDHMAATMRSSGP